jgi:hypothetical protein
MLENEDKKTCSFSIKLPQFHKAKVELWRFLNPNNLDALLGCFEIDDYDEFLKTLTKNEANSLAWLKQTNLNKIPSQNAGHKEDKGNEQFKIFARLISIQMNLNLKDKKDSILVDKYFYLIKYALDHGFGKEQIGALITIIKRTHDVACETSFGNLEQTFDYFKNLLLVYCVHRPPFSLNIFSPKQAQLTIDYVYNTYFKFFKFYKYVFSPDLFLDLSMNYTNLEKETDEKRSEIIKPESRLMINSDERMTSVDEQVDELDRVEQQKQKVERDVLADFVRKYVQNKLNKLQTDLEQEIRANNSEDSNKQANKQAKTRTKSGTNRAK